jgi:predicted tellurium resistance membrane protein TerC
MFAVSNPPIPFHPAPFHPTHTDTCALYFTGYILEQSLSVDNLFVFVKITQKKQILFFLQKNVLQLN